MADPVTLGIILAGVGAATGAVGAVMQGQATSASAKFNQQTALQNATIARQLADEEAERIRTESRRAQGAIRAATGASGIRLEGSPLDVLADSAVEGELAALTAQFRGTLQVRGFEAEAAIAGVQRREARRQTVIGVGSSLLAGGQQAASIKALGS